MTQNNKKSKRNNNNESSNGLRYMHTQLTKAVDIHSLEIIFKTILQYLPEKIVIKEQEYKKSQVTIATAESPRGVLYGLTLIPGANQAPILLFGQRLLDGQLTLRSEFNKEQYNKYILSALPKDSKVYIDLVCYNLIENTDVDKLVKALEACSPPHLTNSQAVALSPETNSMGEILKAHQGVLYLHSHIDEFSWQHFCDEIKKLDRNEVDVCYLEMCKPLLQPLLDKFNETGDVALLKKHLDHYPFLFPIADYFLQICKHCYEKNIKVMASDAFFLTEQVANDKSTISLAAKRDGFIANEIKQTNLRLQNDKPIKFIGLYGAYHYKTAMALNVPAIGFCPTMQSRRIPNTRPYSAEQLEIFKDCQFSKKIESPKQVSNSLLSAKSCCFFVTAITVGAAAVVTYALQQQNRM